MLNINLVGADGTVLGGQDMAVSAEDMKLPLPHFLQRYMEPAMAVIINQYNALSDEQKASVSAYPGR